MKPADILRLRGFTDLYGAQALMLALIEDRARAVMENHSVSEIRIPVIERAELFVRSTGDTSDIVEKQMYTFRDADKAGTSLALRPEGTPGVVRAYINGGFDRRDPLQRFFYSGPMFRRERPQQGRYRQFYQFGVEIFGRADAACDAELLIIIDELRRALKLSLDLQLNSLGCAGCRPAFRSALLEFGRGHLNELCDDCHRRLGQNPLRILDCKVDAALAAHAPKSSDHLCDDCRRHFGLLKKFLTRAEIEYTENPRLVRGLDYYTRTTFEVLSAGVGAQNAVVAGGRYDGLVEALGGASTPAIGFAIGLDRLALAVNEAGAAARAPDRGIPADARPEAYGIPLRRRAVIATLGADAQERAVVLARNLPRHGIGVEILPTDRSLKSQLTVANRTGARFAVIIGDVEIQRGVVRLRDLLWSRSDQMDPDQADLRKEREIPFTPDGAAIAEAVAATVRG